MPKIMLNCRPNGRRQLERPLKETITRGRNRSIKASLVTDDDDDLCINYTIIVSTNDNNAGLNNNNNNNGRLRDLILVFKIPTGARKAFLEIYKKFGHVPSKMFASFGLVSGKWMLREKSFP
jgi:hypothetical protein